MGSIGGLLLLGIFTGPGDETMLVLTLGLTLGLGVVMASTISDGMGVLTGELCGPGLVLCTYVCAA